MMFSVKIKKCWRFSCEMVVSAALCMNAASQVCICTISDDIETELSCDTQKRETSFSDMMSLALDMSLEI